MSDNMPEGKRKIVPQAANILPGIACLIFAWITVVSWNPGDDRDATLRGVPALVMPILPILPTGRLVNK